jgi:hypothetical protein
MCASIAASTAKMLVTLAEKTHKSKSQGIDDSVALYFKVPALNLDE